MGHKHKRHKTLNLTYNPKRTKGKKGHKHRKAWGGKMTLSKHRIAMGGCGGYNHSITIARTREFNREQEIYEKSRKKRNFMCDSIIELFRIKRKFY